uniref:Uncharacterized protein n=1 Tax=Eutreptiella gymnastica TaxID=73025 RepID=A0A7S1N2M6_9EUGL
MPLGGPPGQPQCTPSHTKCMCGLQSGRRACLGSEVWVNGPSARALTLEVAAPSGAHGEHRLPGERAFQKPPRSRRQTPEHTVLPHPAPAGLAFQSNAAG